ALLRMAIMINDAFANLSGVSPIILAWISDEDELAKASLIMMAILNNAFAHSSSSLIPAKMMGLTPAFLTPPLSPLEQVAAFGLGAATRGIVVGAVTALVIGLLPGAGLQVSHPWAIVYFAVGASVILGLAGILAGLWAEKF